jgi:hypothetical protein
MSELVSSAQLAEMALPILPKSKQGIEHVAKRDGWPFEYIKGQGRGGRLKKFVLSELPEEIQTAVRERQAAQLLAQSQPAVLPSVAKAKRPVAVRRMEQLGLPIDDYAMGLNDKQRDCAHARMALAAEVLRLHEVAALVLTACGSTAKPSATAPIKVVERPTLPPAPAELLADYERPAPPASGSPEALLNHAAEYGAWCGKRDAQASGWQQWYRNGQGGKS